MNTQLLVPKFKTEEEEAQFWQENDSADFVDWTLARRVDFPQLKPSLRSISLRLPEPMLARIRALANEQDVPYQSLIKVILAEHLARVQKRA